MKAYEVSRPAVISFSGGRSSAYMLKHVVDAFGTLPDDVHVVFANTGKEFPQTLDFVQRCSDEWNVPITWLEYDPDAEYKIAYVNHNSASRNGEPFEKLIREKGFLPNPVTRVCTYHLKVRRIETYARDVLGLERWTSVVGLRHDEPKRVRRLIDRCGSKERYTAACPMSDARVNERMVREWWDQQPFDLGLEPHESNCDLCFLKGAGKIARIMRDHPGAHRWWADMEALGISETPMAEKFRKDRPDYATMAQNVFRQGDMFEGFVKASEQWDWDGDECACTD